MLTLLLTSMLLLAHNGRPVRAGSAAVYILPSGWISPSTAPMQRNGNTYTLTGNITTSSDGIWVQRDNVTLDGAGYTIQGDGGFLWTNGIYLESRKNVTIENFNIEQFGSTGVCIFTSSDITLTNNTLMNNTGDGISFSSSAKNRIEDNYITENGYNGISIVFSSNNYVCGNKVTVNGQYGIDIYSSSNNSILANELSNNLVEGIGLMSASGNAIVGNSITSNAYYGILFIQSGNNIVSGNTIANNSLGIYLSSSSNNMIYHNNFLGNSQQANAWSGTANFWDQGYPTGGNYWSDYSDADVCNGPYQNETGSDGIGDVPYNVDMIDVDPYPIMQPTTATLCIYPFTVTLDAGQVFNVSLLALHPIDLWAWQAGLQWDPAVLKCVSWAWGEFGTLAGMTEQTPPVIDEGNGTFSGPASESTLTGSGTPVTITELNLLTVAFRIIKPGKCGLRLTNVRLVNQDLSDLRAATVNACVEALPEEFLIKVPYHHQIKSYYCGPAALEEVFDFYGPDISQIEIADAVRTSSDGTYTCDMVRGAHFSNLSTSVGMESRISYTGYTARKLGYATLEYGGMTVEELKSVIATGYPVIVLTTWHFRVAVGYDSNFIIFQDTYYGPMYQMTYDTFSKDWDYSGHWAFLVSPWHVEISNFHNVIPGDQFSVTARVTYPWVPPFPSNWPTATASSATITLPAGLSLASGETTQKILDTDGLAPGQSFNVTWSIQAQAVGNYQIGVEAEGLVNGFMPPLPPYYPDWYTYEDRIGGTSQSTVAVTSSLDNSPPVTTEDYDGWWQNQAFAINLTASDDMSGVLETYYRINDGPKKVLSLDGQPHIATQGANNTLEFWSMDWAGNEELPHKLLTDVKLENTAPSMESLGRTPAGEVQPSQEVKVTVNATDTLSGIQSVTLAYTLDDGTIWTSQAMTLNFSTSLYEATIPGQHAGTLVNFRIVAIDQAGNTAVRASAYQVPRLCAPVTPEREIVNLGCKQQWLTFYIELPEGYSVDNIDITSLALNDTIMADPNFKNVGHDQNGVPYLLVCFNRTLVLQSVFCSGNVTLSFNGRLNDGSLFEGLCMLEVRMPGDVNLDGKVDVKDISCVARSFGSCLGQPGYKSILDENEDNRIDIKDIALVAKNFGKTYS